MNPEIEKLLENLDSRRAQILQVLCEDRGVFHPEILIQLVHEVRGITDMIKIIKGNNVS